MLDDKKVQRVNIGSVRRWQEWILRLVIRSSSALPVRVFLALMMWSGAVQNRKTDTTRKPL
ncbi:hypothetical protein ACULNC_00795 [Shigella flexneri]